MVVIQTHTERKKKDGNKKKQKVYSCLIIPCSLFIPFRNYKEVAHSSYLDFRFIACMSHEVKDGMHVTE